MLTLMDADSLDCAYQILGLDIPEQKKNSLKLLLKYILRQFNSEDIEGGDDGGSHWYVKVFPKSHGPFSFKQKSKLIENGLFDSNQLSQNFIWKN